MTRPTPRTRLLTIRLTPAEHSAATAYARARNLPLSELVRAHLASLSDPTPPTAIESLQRSRRILAEARERLAGIVI
jgi:hypothetical protein